MTSKPNGQKKVDLERFAALMDAYGAEPAAWPEDERDAALDLLDSSQEAAELRDEAAALDDMFAVAPIEPSPELRRRVLQAAPERRLGWAEQVSRWAEAFWPFGPSWQPATALLAAAVAGVAFGVLLPEASASEDADVMVVAEVALDTGYDWSETP